LGVKKIIGILLLIIKIKYEKLKTKKIWYYLTKYLDLGVILVFLNLTNI